MRLTLDLQRRGWNALAGEGDAHFLAISGPSDEDSRRGPSLVQLQRARWTMDRFSTEDDHHLALDISAIDAKNLLREEEAKERHQGEKNQQRKPELAP